MDNSDVIPAGFVDDNGSEQRTEKSTLLSSNLDQICIGHVLAHYRNQVCREERSSGGRSGGGDMDSVHVAEFGGAYDSGAGIGGRGWIWLRKKSL